MTKLKIVSSLAAAGVLVFAGCSKHEKSEEINTAAEAAQGGEEQAYNPPPAYQGTPGETDYRGVPGQGEPAYTPQASAKRIGELNDGEIAKITDVVNSGEIQQARLAQSQADNPNVQQFAAMMIEDHTRAKENGAKLAVELKLVPEESALATELADGAQETLQSLQTGDSASFDRRYMEAQVNQHQEVLDMLDKQLIPSAQSPELKAELEKTRGVVQHHLDQAKQIKAALGIGNPND
jgi:putative membrane protein